MPVTQEAYEPPTVQQTRRNLDPHSQLVMDAKGLYDNLLSEQQSGDDERAALEVTIIKEDLDAVGGKVRWVPHNKNPADALTKGVGAHAVPLAEMLRTCRLRIRAEDEELEERKIQKETLGYNPRSKQMTKLDTSDEYFGFPENTADRLSSESHPAPVVPQPQAESD